MNPHANGITLQPPAPTPEADWPGLIDGAREALVRLDATLSLDEAKAALVGQLRERRRQSEAARLG